MNLAEEAQKAAQRQQAQAAKVAKAAVTKARRDHLAWVRDRTGLDTAAKFIDDRTFAVGEYHGETPVCVNRTYPCYSLDGVTVALDTRARELLLVCTDENLGEYIGPRVFTSAAAQYTKAQKRKKLVGEVGKAMNAAAPHPLLVLREANAECPTCRRSW